MKNKPLSNGYACSQNAIRKRQCNSASLILMVATVHEYVSNGSVLRETFSGRCSVPGPMLEIRVFGLGSLGLERIGLLLLMRIRILLHFQSIRKYFYIIFIHPKIAKIIQGIIFLNDFLYCFVAQYSHESKSGSMNCVRGFGCPNCPQFGCIRQNAKPVTEVTFLVTFLFRNLFEGGDGGGHEAAGKRCP